MISISLKTRSVVGQIPRALQGEAARITSAGLRVGEAVAKQRAPVRTGFLRSSIAVVADSQTSGRLVVRANYAGYVNFGTRRMAARPFATAGAEAMTNYIIREWGRGVEGGLPRV